MTAFSIKTPPQHADWGDLLAIWQAADDMEVFESAWNFDHFYPLTDPVDGGCLEGGTTLAALAQATKRIRVGTMVHGMHYRHPLSRPFRTRPCQTCGSAWKRPRAGMRSASV